MLENLDKIMHLRFNFDACPMHSPFGFVHLTHQNLSGRALFCLNSLAKVNTHLLIYILLLLKSANWIEQIMKQALTSRQLSSSDSCPVVQVQFSISNQRPMPDMFV